jgi:hypothetical protein
LGRTFLFGTPINKKKFEGGYLFEKIVYSESGLNFVSNEKYY